MSERRDASSHMKPLTREGPFGRLHGHRDASGASLVAASHIGFISANVAGEAYWYI